MMSSLNDYESRYLKTEKIYMQGVSSFFIMGGGQWGTISNGKGVTYITLCTFGTHFRHTREVELKYSVRLYGRRARMDPGCTSLV